MARIKPFQGLRFNTDKVERMEDVVSPPYDVIDEEGKAALLEKNRYNMVKLDLTKDMGDGPLAARYEDARALAESWQDDEVLIRDTKPAFYLYFVDYTLANGRKFTRKGLVARVQLAEFAEGVVKPHEKIFRNVVTDRLQLLDTCRTQFSQIFSLYPDEENGIMKMLEDKCPANPLYSVEDQDGCFHRLWAVNDPDTLAAVVQAFQERALYIADGHHRYTTALQFRELLQKRHGSLDPDSSLNHIMMYLCPMEDPGLSVLPTHRLLNHPDKVGTDQLVEQLIPCFQVEEVGAASREDQVSEVLARMEDLLGGATAFGMYDPSAERCFLLTLKDGAMEKELGDKQDAALRELDVVVLSDLLLERLLGLPHKRCDDEGLISYHSDPDLAMDAAVKQGVAGSGSSILFLMNPTTVAQVRNIADESLIMPHKSTYFYPKILTGLLLNKFDD